ncbi:MAG: hypothetical protein KGI54_14965, partial [Pseudomonadota bacterium]|nr:hypothetical protein [Pseudomonadota bacterium]
MSRHYTKMMREQAKLGAALEKHTLAALANQKKVESSTGLPYDLIRALEALKPSIAGVTHVQGMRQSYMREQTKIINQAHAENEKYDKSRWNMFKQEAIEEDRRRTKEKRRQYEFSQDYFRNQEFSRLGHKGAQAVNTGGLRELIKIDRHLSGMEHTLDRFAKSNGLTPQEQEARRKSARETLARSYSQISAAAAEAPGIKGFLARAIVTSHANKAREAAGLSPFSGGYGSGGIAGRIGRGALGGLGIGLEALDALGPIAGTIGAIGLGVYETPRLISGAMNKIYQGAKPYYNLQNFAGTYGLAGGISGRSIMSSLMPGNKLAPSWMTKYGLTQQDVMARVSQYGIAPTSLSQLQNMALMPSLMKYSGSLAGLSDDQRYAANKSFLLSGGNTGKQWTQLQRIMTTAVADGADLASVNRAILATMQQG